MSASKHIPRIVLVLSLMSAYLATLAPGLTWANNGADGGDLISATATGGIAHPSGYPTYLLIARFFQWIIPSDSLAFRTNLMSALIAVCAAWVVYELVSASQGWLAGLASGYALGLSPLFWSQAVITEVYTLHVLFIAILLFLSTQRPQRHFLLGFVLGLGIGNHVTTAFMLPTLFHSEKKIFLKRIAGALSGTLIYLTLPLRALSHPPVNWGNPVTLENFLWLVSGKLYHGQIFHIAAADLPGRVQAAAALFLEQFGAMGLLIGLTGLIVCYQPTRLNREALWTALAFSVFPLTYNTRDSFLYLLPAFLCFAIWIGVGVNYAMSIAARRSSQWSWVVGLIFLALLILRAGGYISQVDASRDDRAENFGREAMARIPKNAIVFAKGDPSVLALWYFHYALRERPDMVVIAADLLPNAWYQETIRNHYPALTLPDFFMFPEVVIAYNPERTICRVEGALAAQIECEAR